MRPESFLFALGGLGAANAQQYTVPSSVYEGGVPFESFVSYSIEFSSFPDFAGNNSHPNTFSNNLLENIGNIIGTKPHIRVGGNTQDYALYNASLPYALNGTYNYTRSADYPTTIYIGPSYFESYNTFNATRFSFGFNLALGATTAAGWQTLQDVVPLACAALGGGKLYWWEYGNEPDLYSTSAQGPVRPTTWNESTYVQQWLNGTREIKRLLQQNCPALAAGSEYGYFAPSFGGVGNTLKAPVAFQDGLTTDGDVKLFSTHNYISGATSPGVTLQGTLMNHTSTVNSVNAHLTEYAQIAALAPTSSPPLMFGECNSLYNEGAPGLSNSFGAALWGVDFNLYSASVGFRRVHMHQGTDYRYAAWQPITTNDTVMGTKAPYYGNIAVAAMLGNIPAQPPSIVQIPLEGDTRQAAYAAYVDDVEGSKTLARIMVINMVAYNTTVNGTGEVPLPAPDTAPRPSLNYTFAVPGLATQLPAVVSLQRLWANGSDAITGITWDGWSYNYELNNGLPVRLDNVTVGETAAVNAAGAVSVTVPASSAVLLNFLS